MRFIVKHPVLAVLVVWWCLITIDVTWRSVTSTSVSGDWIVVLVAGIFVFAVVLKRSPEARDKVWDVLKKRFSSTGHASPGPMFWNGETKPGISKKRPSP